MKMFLLGVAAAFAILFVAGAAVLRFGVVDVSADLPPPAWETKLMPEALHASVARRAPKQPNPFPPTEENRKAGAEAYRATCAKCHGATDGEPGVYGASFYPPAPRLSGGLPQYTDAELFWTIKHGIRNTGMPAWARMLSDEEVWHIVTFLKRPGELPADR